MFSRPPAAPGLFMKKLGHLNQSRKWARGGFYFYSNIFVFVHFSSEEYSSIKRYLYLHTFRGIYLYSKIFVFVYYQMKLGHLYKSWQWGREIRWYYFYCIFYCINWILINTYMYTYRCISIYADIVGFTRHWGKVLLVLCLTSKALLEHPMFSDKDFFLPRQDLSFARGTYMLSWCDKCFDFPTMNLDLSVYHSFSYLSKTSFTIYFTAL